MADHTHPDYERSFDRMTTILERVVERQQEVVEAQLRQEQAHAALEKALERLAIKSAESEDKLNALIDLMDRHQREHGRQ